MMSSCSGTFSSSLGTSCRFSSEFCQKFTGRPRRIGDVLQVTLLDGALDLWVPELEVIFKLIGAHDAGDRDAVFFQDEVFLIAHHPIAHHPADDLAEVDAGFGDGEMMDHSIQFIPLMNID